MTSLARSRLALLPLFAAALIGCGGSSDSSSRAPVDAGPNPDGAGVPDDDPVMPGETEETPGGDAASGGGAVPAGGVGTDSGAPFEHVGYIAIVRTTPANSLFDGAPLPGATPGASASALLTRSAEPFTLAEYREGRAEERDRCTRYVDGVAVEGALAGVAGDTSAFVSGGEVLTIRSPQGSYAELVATSSANGVSYRMSGTDSLPLPVPDGLVADIPGADFPALSNVPIPHADPLVVLGESAADLLSREFRWEAGSDPSAIVNLIVTTISTDRSSDGFLCTATDDGEFTAPEWTATMLDAGGLSASRTIQRETYALTVDGSTLLVGSTITPYNASGS